MPEAEEKVISVVKIYKLRPGARVASVSLKRLG